ncbi:PAS domain-containing sensor histidine kinase [Lutibacter flavus]|uniref:histidine kinase n=1 Tax=Lutibacter flavus TaxID=691689 RepID=A0A238VL97_9FLAO|nr:ATP-binding protein [Lutibacter flavus]SNR34944.1 PAS/PAC sensor signal transduction histidine kinase [Lutibacter flavus]
MKIDTKPTYQDLENQITELKKQNVILHQHATSHEKGIIYYYNTILNSIGDPVFVKDHKSRLLIVNDAFCEIFNLSRDKIIGKTLVEDVLDVERESFLKIDRQVLNNGIENINEESLTVRGGQTKIISTRKTRFIDSDGNKFVIGVIHDISKRYKSENKLKEREKQLKNLNASKDKLFSIIAHDLRNPFNSILGFSELLKENLEKKEKSKVYVNIINSSAKTTLILLNNLLNWAKSQTGQINYTNSKIILSSIIQEIIDVSNSQAKIKNITINKIKSDEIEVYANENMVKTILQNLISNAIKFTKSEGTINIAVISQQNQVEISISDNGVGINKDKLNLLFNVSSNPTSFGTEGEKGSGLGLVLCKEFVEILNGEIWVKSEVGKGSDFKFTLPLYKC